MKRRGETIVMIIAVAGWLAALPVPAAPTTTLPPPALVAGPDRAHTITAIATAAPQPPTPQPPSPSQDKPSQPEPKPASEPKKDSWAITGWEGLAQAATVIAAVIALLAACIGLITYADQARNASRGFMSTLFQEYLRLRFDYTKDASTTPGNEAKDENADALWIPRDDREDSQLGNLVASKLYALEIMHDWVERRRWLWWALLPFNAVFGRHRLDDIRAWQETIRVHGRHARPATLQSIRLYEGCYSVRFLDFLAKDWGNLAPLSSETKKLAELVASNRRLVRMGRRRRAGQRRDLYAEEATRPPNPPPRHALDKGAPADPSPHGPQALGQTPP
jgi:hypothetical protein